jgi:chromosome segregation ATPase
MMKQDRFFWTLLGAVTINVMISAEGVALRKAAQAKNYAIKKRAIDSKISLAEQCLQEKMTRLNDAKSMFERDKQEVRDALQNVDRAKAETKELDSWYRALPKRSGENNQVTEVQIYANKKELLDNKIRDLERIAQEKEFKANRSKHAVEEAQQAVNTVTQELKSAHDELVALEHWYTALPD